MPQVKEIHTDAILTNMSVMFRNAMFVADKIVPPVPVKKDTDKYYEYDKSHFRPDETAWARKTRAKEVDWGVSTKAYSTERHALSHLVEDDEVDNADSPIDPFRDTVENLTEKILVRREKRVATTIRATANNGGSATLVGVQQWSDFANSDPVTDVETGVDGVFSKVFRKPNTILIPWPVYRRLKNHPDLLDRIKYTQKGVLTPDLLGSIFDLENVIIAGAGENTAKEGQVDVLSYIWGKDVWLGYVESRPGLKKVSYAYQIRSQDLKVERWMDEERDGEMVRTSIKDVPHLIAKDCGYVIKDAVA